MKILAKVYKFGELVNTFISDAEDQILAADKFDEELEAFIEEYLHEHPDELENVYTVVKSPNLSIEETMKRGKIPFIKKRENFLNNQGQLGETTIRKKNAIRKFCIDSVWNQKKNIIKQKYFSVYNGQVELHNKTN